MLLLAKKKNRAKARLHPAKPSITEPVTIIARILSNVDQLSRNEAAATSTDKIIAVKKKVASVCGDKTNSIMAASASEYDVSLCKSGGNCSFGFIAFCFSSFQNGNNHSYISGHDNYRCYVK